VQNGCCAAHGKVRRHAIARRHALALGWEPLPPSSPPSATHHAANANHPEEGPSTTKGSSPRGTLGLAPPPAVHAAGSTAAAQGHALQLQQHVLAFLRAETEAEAAAALAPLAPPPPPPPPPSASASLPAAAAAAAAAHTNGGVQLELSWGSLGGDSVGAAALAYHRDVQGLGLSVAALLQGQSLYALRARCQARLRARRGAGAGAGPTDRASPPPAAHSLPTAATATTQPTPPPPPPHAPPWSAREWQREAAGGSCSIAGEPAYAHWLASLRTALDSPAAAAAAAATVQGIEPGGCESAVLLSGATGFLGAQLLAALLSSGSWTTVRHWHRHQIRQWP
jgi:hypothetical protein